MSYPGMIDALVENKRGYRRRQRLQTSALGAVSAYLPRVIDRCNSISAMAGAFERKKDDPIYSENRDRCHALGRTRRKNGPGACRRLPCDQISYAEHGGIGESDDHERRGIADEDGCFQEESADSECNGCKLGKLCPDSLRHEDSRRPAAQPLQCKKRNDKQSKSRSVS